MPISCNEMRNLAPDKFIMLPAYDVVPLCRSLGIRSDKFIGNGDLRVQARHWMLECIPQAVRHITAEAASVCRAVAASVETNQSLAAPMLSPLVSMMQKCQPTKEHMTPVHAAVLKVYASPSRSCCIPLDASHARVDSPGCNSPSAHLRGPMQAAIDSSQTPNSQGTMREEVLHRHANSSNSSLQPQQV